MIEFVWDESKGRTNVRKHGITFDEVKTVFYDANARLAYDGEHSTDEDRFVLLGLSVGLKILVICHCYREEDEIIRIISARKATRKEAGYYWSSL